MEECLEAMLEEERQHQRNQTSSAWSTATNTVENNGAELCQQLGSLRVHDEVAKRVILKLDAILICLSSYETSSFLLSVFYFGFFILNGKISDCVLQI